MALHIRSVRDEHCETLPHAVILTVRSRVKVCIQESTFNRCFSAYVAPIVQFEITCMVPYLRKDLMHFMHG